MKNSILDCPMEFIENSIEIGIKALKNGGEIRNLDSDLKNIYFVGRTLCLDVKNHANSEDRDIITLSHSDEDFGYFSGGTRRLLSIKALKSFENLMRLTEIKHKPKWNY